jgi:uncharacterized phiE125 gp8 family phage protein
MMVEELALMAPEPGIAPISLAECKAYLRIGHDDDDAVIAGFIRTAMALCEAFTGQWLISRDGEARLVADGNWQRLPALPVNAISEVRDALGVLPVAQYEIDIDAAGCGWVCASARSAASAVAVRFRAGLAPDWNGLPEPLRQGMIRLVAHLYAHRDAADAGPPPTAVAALWRPWRRMRLG